MLNDLSPDASGNVAAVAEVLEYHGLADRWAFRGRYPDGRCYGMTEAQIQTLYREADGFYVTGAQGFTTSCCRSRGGSTSSPIRSPRRSRSSTATRRRRRARRARHALHLRREHRPGRLRHPDHALQLAADPPAGARRSVAPHPLGRWRAGHDDHDLAQQGQGRCLRRRALLLDQGPRVRALPRPAAAAPRSLRTGRRRRRRDPQAAHRQPLAPALVGRSLPASPATATTSSSRAASSRSPATSTCGRAPAGSAIAPPATWPPAGR